MRQITAALFLILLSEYASSHHSISAFYDNENARELEGTITSVRWVNPHIKFNIERLGENGQLEDWVIESAAINMLERSGIKTSDISVGTHIKINGFVSKRGRKAMIASYITLPNGENIEMWPGLFGGLSLVGLKTRSNDPSATDNKLASKHAQGIFRVWTVGLDSRGRRDKEETLPLTPEALVARGGYDPLVDDTALQCISQGMPGIMDNPFPMEFIDKSETIILHTEEWDVIRTIHMVDNADAENEPATPHGYSRGHWEGNTLVVVTTNIGWPYFDDIGTPMSPAVKIIERYTLSDDENRLDMTMTVTDPATFTQPVHLDGNWIWEPDEKLKPYDCKM
jgi:hypothetical protein